MNDDDGFNVRAVIDRACTSKRKIDTPGEARAIARHMNDQAKREHRDDVYRSYRCPFGDGTRKHAHWHCGHVPSLEALQNIARAIRESHQHPEQLSA